MIAPEAPIITVFGYQNKPEAPEITPLKIKTAKYHLFEKLKENKKVVKKKDIKL